MKMFIKKYSESNRAYGESVISAVKVFRGSMEKNTLMSNAIYGAFCFYTRLRVLSGYPSAVFGKYSMKKRKSVCPSNELYRISARTLSFINYSDGVKYKGKRSFFPKSLEFQDLRFSRKFCREIMIDVRSILVIKNLQKLKTRIIQQNISHEIFNTCSYFL